ncbi:MAG: DUF2461 domain-containing protein [Deltaproteobacteria bacterium]|nr:DUF2461 domain-containing protein [Deltaproteobacteria bacterium]
MPDFFSDKTLKVLSDLQKNNNREWYHENKNRLEEFLFAPARQMVVDIGQILNAHTEKLVAEPKIDRSIYRLYRDTRFSKDKNPYKDHLGLIWWHDLPEGKLSSPCFYFHLMPEGFIWSVGIYALTPPTLLAFRRDILDPQYGPNFKTLAAQIRKMGVDFNPPELKLMPSGLTGPTWTHEWLKRKSLYTWSGTYPNDKSTILGPNGARFLGKFFSDAKPLYWYLVKLINKAREIERETPPPKFRRPPLSNPDDKVRLQEDDF